MVEHCSQADTGASRQPRLSPRSGWAQAMHRERQGGPLTAGCHDRESADGRTARTSAHLLHRSRNNCVRWVRAQDHACGPVRPAVAPSRGVPLPAVRAQHRGVASCARLRVPLHRGGGSHSHAADHRQGTASGRGARARERGATRRAPATWPGHGAWSGQMSRVPPRSIRRVGHRHPRWASDAPGVQSGSNDVGRFVEPAMGTTATRTSRRRRTLTW